MDNIKQIIESISSETEVFLSGSAPVYENCRQLCRSLHQMKQSDVVLRNDQLLNDLLLTQFDDEQVWQQIQIDNSTLLKNRKRLIECLGSLNDITDDLADGLTEEEEDSEVDDERDMDQDVLQDSEGATTDGEEGDIDSENDKAPVRKMAAGPPPPLDINQLEKFLDEQDEKEVERLEREKRGDVNSDDDIDYFQELPDDDEDEQEEKEDEEKDVLVDEEEDDEGLDEGEGTDDDDIADDEDLAMDEEDEEMEEDVENEEDVAPEEVVKNKSSFEKRQDKLRRQISELESAALEDKPWQLMGEVMGQNRDKDALLQEDLDFDQQTRQAPVVTEETTRTLEQIIVQRIKDKAFDDVVRKEKPKEDVFEYKKRIVLDQEKSKQSLQQIYEQEYLKQAQTEEQEKVDPEKEGIKQLLKTLFTELDALANFHYTPKPAEVEIKVMKNLASLVMEEVQPISVSEGATLAPEEVQEKPKAAPKGPTEKTPTDKKRERRKKKNIQKAKFENKEQKLKKLEDKKTKREKSQRTNLSSTAFFSQLQDQVKQELTGVKQKIKTLKSKSKSKDFVALKL